VGFLLFTARKLQLKRELNEMSYQQTQISNAYKQAQKETADFQKNMAMAKGTASVWTEAGMSGLSLAGNGVVQSQLKDGNTEKAAIAQNNVNNGVNIARQMMQNSQNSVFDAINNVKLAQLQAKENTLSQEADSMATRISFTQQEYDAAKSAEKEEVKNATPTFGLG